MDAANEDDHNDDHNYDDVDEHDHEDRNCHNLANFQVRRSRFCMVLDLNNT